MRRRPAAGRPGPRCWAARSPGTVTIRWPHCSASAARCTARPALHAALYGRAVAALRAWTGQPDLRVALTMIPEAARPALARDGVGVAAQLPFGWISDVWARGLATVWDHFCLAAAPAGEGWALPAVGPDLGPPVPVTISVPPPG